MDGNYHPQMVGLWHSVSHIIVANYYPLLAAINQY
jgi:hypothetical protein